MISIGSKANASSSFGTSVVWSVIVGIGSTGSTESGLSGPPTIKAEIWSQKAWVFNVYPANEGKKSLWVTERNPLAPKKKHFSSYKEVSPVDLLPKKGEGAQGWRESIISTAFKEIYSSSKAETFSFWSSTVSIFLDATHHAQDHWTWHAYLIRYHPHPYHHAQAVLATSPPPQTGQGGRQRYRRHYY